MIRYSSTSNQPKSVCWVLLSKWVAPFRIVGRRFTVPLRPRQIEAPYTPPAKDIAPQPYHGGAEILNWVARYGIGRGVPLAPGQVSTIAPQEPVGIKNKHIAKEYHSIGQFYDEFRKGERGCT